MPARNPEHWNCPRLSVSKQLASMTESRFQKWYSGIASHRAGEVVDLWICWWLRWLLYGRSSVALAVSLNYSAEAGREIAKVLMYSLLVSYARETWREFRYLGQCDVSHRSRTKERIWTAGFWPSFTYRMLICTRRRAGWLTHEDCEGVCWARAVCDRCWMSFAHSSIGSVSTHLYINCSEITFRYLSRKILLHLR